MSCLNRDVLAETLKSTLDQKYLISVPVTTVNPEDLIKMLTQYDGKYENEIPIYSVNLLKQGRRLTEVFLKRTKIFFLFFFLAKTYFPVSEKKNLFVRHICKRHKKGPWHSVQHM